MIKKLFVLLIAASVFSSCENKEFNDCVNSYGMDFCKTIFYDDDSTQYNRQLAMQCMSEDRPAYECIKVVD